MLSIQLQNGLNTVGNNGGISTPRMWPHPRRATWCVWSRSRRWQPQDLRCFERAAGAKAARPAL